MEDANPGHGPNSTIPSLMRSGDICLKAFEPHFTDTVLELRNHESVRMFMRDTNPIPRESHYRWVKENIVEQRKVHLFVVHEGTEAVGIALLRDFRDRTAEVGLMVADAPRRRLSCYAGAFMIGNYGLEVLGLDRLFSYVPRHNEHAFAFNKHFGFVQDGVDDDPVYHRLVLTRECFRMHPTHRRFREKHGLSIEQPA